MAVKEIAAKGQEHQQLEEQQAREVGLAPLHGAAHDLLAGGQGDAQAGKQAD
jgi:hypothetical protein